MGKKAKQKDTSYNSMKDVTRDALDDMKPRRLPALYDTWHQVVSSCSRFFGVCNTFREYSEQDNFDSIEDDDAIDKLFKDLNNQTKVLRGLKDKLDLSFDEAVLDKVVDDSEDAEIGIEDVQAASKEIEKNHKQVEALIVRAIKNRERVHKAILEFHKTEQYKNDPAIHKGFVTVK